MGAWLGTAGQDYQRKDTEPRARQAKIIIRQRMLREIAPAYVFDAFAGSGVMHDEVWHRAERYVGCDTKLGAVYDANRRRYTGDNRKLMRALDLSQFNVFDFDAYGSPWEQLTILAERRTLEPDEKIGVVFTEGSFLETRMISAVPRAMAVLAGVEVRGHHYARQYDRIFERALEGFCARLGAKVTLRWQARGGASGARTIYAGMVLARLT